MDHISRVGVFLEVVKHQSFAGAARALGVTGPALSKQVQLLEDQLGVRLLHRTTRLVTLTEEGALYFERAAKALDDLNEAESHIQELKARPMGTLKVNVPMSFGKQYLAQPIAAFAKEYPDVKMEIMFDDRNVDMIAEGFDVVVRIGVLEDSSFIARQLATCPIILCASADFMRQHGNLDTPEQLKEYPAVIFNAHDNANEWRYRHVDGETGVARLNRHFAANNGDMMLEACLQGVGISLLPIFLAATYLKSGQLVELLPDYQTHPERGIYAIFPQNRHLSARTRLFVDWLSQCSKAFPW